MDDGDPVLRVDVALREEKVHERVVLEGEGVEFGGAGDVGP